MSRLVMCGIFSFLYVMVVFLLLCPSHIIITAAAADNSNSMGYGTKEYGKGPCTSEYPCCETYPCVPDPNTRHLTIGLIQPLDGPIAGDEYLTRAGAQLAIDTINANSMLGKNITLVALLGNGNGDEPGGFNAALQIGLLSATSGVNTKRVPMIVGPIYTAEAKVGCLVSEQLRIPSLSSAVTSPALSDKSLYERFSRIIPSDSYQGIALAHLVQYYGWTQVATVYTNNEYGSSLVAEFANALKGVASVVTSVSFDAGADPTTQIQLLKSSGARIFLLASGPEDARAVMRTASLLGMTGNGFQWLGTDAWNNGGTTPIAEFQGVVGAIPLLQAETPAYITYRKLWDAAYAKDTRRVLNESEPNVWAGLQYDAVMFAAKALNNTLNLSPTRDFSLLSNETLLLQSIRSLRMPGVTGDIDLNSKGDRLGAYDLQNVQCDRSSNVCTWTSVGRYINSTWSVTSPVQWSGYRDTVPLAVPKQVTRYETVPSSALYAVVAVAIAGIALSLIALCLNIYFRQTRIVKLSSPNVNNCIIAGCILIYISAILLGLDQATISSSRYTQVCSAKLWTVSIGFTLVFGTMFSKTYRVHRIFNSRSLGKKKILDSQLFAIICALLVIDIIILGIWTGVDPLKEDITYSPPSRVNADLMEVVMTQRCRSNNPLGFYIALLAYKGLILGLGTYLAIEIRNVNFETLNDSKMIGVSIYNIAVIAPIILIISFLFPDNVSFAFAFSAWLIMLCATVTMVLVFAPKFLGVFRAGNSQNNSARAKSITSGTGSDEFAHLTTLQDIVARCTCPQNAMAKKDLITRSPRLKSMTLQAISTPKITTHGNGHANGNGNGHGHHHARDHPQRMSFQAGNMQQHLNMNGHGNNNNNNNNNNGQGQAQPPQPPSPFEGQVPRELQYRYSGTTTGTSNRASTVFRTPTASSPVTHTHTLLTQRDVEDVQLDAFPEPVHVHVPAATTSFSSRPPAINRI